MKLHIVGCSSVYPCGGGATSSYLVETNHGGVLVDCGHEAPSKLLEYSGLRELSAVIISHMHPDHFYGLFALSNCVVAENPRPLPLYLPPGGSGVLQRVADKIGADYERVLGFFDLAEYDPARSHSINGLTIQMMPTKHPVNTHAMCFSESASENRLVFTSDTAWFDELVAFCSGAQLLLVEATDYPQPESNEPVQRWHLGPAEAGRLIREAKVDRAVVTHYDARYSDALLAEVRSVSSNARVVLARPHEEHVI